MYPYAVTLFVFLCISMIFSSLRTGRWAGFARIFQWIVTLTSVFFFVLWFFDKSVSNVYGNNYSDLSIKIINKLPENIDFYVITCGEGSEDCIDHFGKIKQDHYRILFLNSDETKEFKLLGFISDKKLKYYSVHSIETEVLEIDTYTSQEQSISDSVIKKINNYTDRIIEKSILISLSLLLIFLHVSFLTRKNKN